MNTLYGFVENNLATRQDIESLRHEIENLSKDMETLEHKLTVKMGTMLTIAVGLIVTLQKLI